MGTGAALGQEIRATLEKELSGSNGPIRRYPVEKCLSIITRFHSNSYRTIPEEIRRIFFELKHSFGTKGMASYAKLLLVVLMEESKTRLHAMNLPKDVEELVGNWFDRILSETSTQPDDYYQLSNDLFLRDLALASLKLVPVGCEMVEAVRIGRRYLYAGGILQFFRALSFAATKTRSLNPIYYQRHMDDRCLDEFNLDGVRLCCLRLAQMCERNPGIAGITEASWLFDPKVWQISPRLAWKRRFAEMNRLTFFNLGRTAIATRLAIGKSEKRRRLYEQGKYKPLHYLTVWPRAELIAWQERQSRELDLGVEPPVLEARARELESELERAHPGFSRKFPVELYLDSTALNPKYSSYRYTNPRLAMAFEQIEQEFGKKAIADYYRLVLIEIMKQSLSEIKNRAFPSSVLALYKEWFTRIFDELSKLPDSYYDPRKDLFRRDFAVVALRLIPVGFLVEESGMELKQFASLPSSLILKSILGLSAMRGFRPYYYMHLEMRYLKKYFNLEGWKFNYRRVAELLEMNPHVKGMSGSSWFYDPQLEHISPHLAHLRKIPIAYGARVFKTSSTEQTLRLAIANSPQRTKLFLEGSYRPAQYTLLWPRDGILRWAKENRE